MNKWIFEKYIKDIKGNCESSPSIVLKGKTTVLEHLATTLEIHTFLPGNEQLKRDVYNDKVIITVERQFSKTVYTLPN